MLSCTAEYALRAVVCLARHGGQALTTHQIANATSVPAGYLTPLCETMIKTQPATGPPTAVPVVPS
jgi:DNA-binding IscR family transcriptional regulator